MRDKYSVTEVECLAHLGLQQQRVLQARTGPECLGPRRGASRRRGGEWGKPWFSEEAGGKEAKVLPEPLPGPPETWAVQRGQQESVWPRVWHEAHPLQPRGLATPRRLGGDRAACFQPASQSRQTMTSEVFIPRTSS